MDGQKDKENSQKMNLMHIDDLKCPELALYASTSEAGCCIGLNRQKAYLSRRAPR